MPHFKPVQSGIDKLLDLVVRQQHGITAGITGMRNDTDSPACLTARTTSAASGDGVGM